LETSPQPNLFPDSLVTEIKVLSNIAQSTGSLISLEEIAILTHCDLSVEQLEVGWKTNPDLADTFELHEGFLIQRDDSGARISLLQREFRKRAIAEKNIQFAKGFARLCGGRRSVLIALSGSTSYRSTSETDDLDFFCITNTSSLWIFLSKALLLARIYRFSRRYMPRACFSYVIDENFAKRAFSSSRDPLFARDALSAIVLAGNTSYTDLLKKSAWISNHFPKLYLQRIQTKELTGEPENRESASPFARSLNHLLRIVVGSYIAAKSKLLNRKFRSSGKPGSLFAVRIGLDHCIFESARYSKLRMLYDQLGSNPVRTKPVITRKDDDS